MVSRKSKQWCFGHVHAQELCRAVYAAYAFAPVITATDSISYERSNATLMVSNK